MENAMLGAKNTALQKKIPFRAKMKKALTTALISTQIAMSIASYQPLHSEPLNKTEPVVFSRDKFFLDEYISNEADGSKYSRKTVALSKLQSLVYTEKVLDSLKTMDGFRTQPKNDSDVIALGNTIRNHLFKRYSMYPLGPTDFVLEAFYSWPKRPFADCDTKAIIAGQLFKFYGLEPILVELTTPKYVPHTILEVKTKWRSSLYFDLLAEDQTGYDLKWLQRTYPAVLARSKLEPMDIHTLYTKAVVLLDTHPNKAIKALEQIIKKDSSYSPAYWIVAIAYSRNNNYHKALEYMDKAIKLAPNYAGYYYERATISGLHEDWNNQLVYLNKALELDRTFSGALLDRARLLYSAGQYKKAARDFEAFFETLTGDEFSEQDYFKLFICYKQMGSKKTASEFFGGTEEMDYLGISEDKINGEISDLDRVTPLFAKKIAKAIEETP